ncbi:uncharacterized protein FSUBG_339 [Fusarium subglutinans]|uniref:Uncharacterized protein n=1 Tax=Gibberella subglutinans TaxID=42677 RepID=A0A8H5V798_GIBSU|nr:uncharacterized protein FSUBG_339 [Fusarium subglutinans]KAF5613727.1 hypothetical protein FSUBG_339 [Fusarium subglutinans]
MVTVASGGAPLVIAGTIAKEAMLAITAAQTAAAGFTAQAALAGAACETALAGAVAAEAVGAFAVAETAFAAAVAAEGAGLTATASAVAATNFWNPVGWTVGAIVVGARETAPQTITWDCYKPIIREDPETTVKPMLLAELVVHPMVARVEISGKATSAGLPDFEIENVAGELYLVRGVMLPWGAVAYHADKMEG